MRTPTSQVQILPIAPNKRREDKMSSKKKKRRAAFLVRETKRIERKEADKKHNEAMNTGDIEKMASAMGLKVK